MLLQAKREVGAKRLHSAFSLFEVLITLSLGSVLLFIISAFYSDLYLAQNKQNELAQLQKNTHQILDYLQHHIFHSGYQGRERENSNFSFFQRANRSILVERNCLILIQDLNDDGCLGKKSKLCASQSNSLAADVIKEIVAVKVENKQLYVPSKQNKFSPCTLNECRELLSGCETLKWEKIAEISDSYIEKLQFSWEKVDRLVKIEITLSSIKDPNLQYSATAYSYLLNGEQ